MAIADNPIQVGTLALSIIILPIVCVAITLRFIATRKAGRNIGAEDWCALVATLATIGYNIISIYIIHVLNGRPFTELPLDTLTGVLKVAFVCTQLFPLNQVFAKLSILLLYHRIFGINKRYALWIMIAGVLQVCWGVSAVGALLFQCRPMHKYWDVLTPGWCMDSVALLVAFEVPNSSLDFGMVAIVLVMLRDLRIRPSTKWKLSFLFAAGGFSGLIGFLKIAAHFTAGQSNFMVLAMWGLAQMLLSVICCCVPSYNSLKFLKPSGSGFSRLLGSLKSKSSTFFSSSPASPAPIPYNPAGNGNDGGMAQPRANMAGKVGSGSTINYGGGSWGWLQTPEAGVAPAGDVKPPPVPPKDNIKVGQPFGAKVDIDYHLQLSKEGRDSWV
ncbi:hypothetical protein B0T22DRAFT_513340 [Podospora appendiculata]|uniref:Rhodopsin domain-containing protein n=1 Tax=Podospora appendiculata TaxID=314037 RepID=A0AAE0XAS7_9PEZI|nr:hypothetical protein B0T22DRAFT_513340 [Podospora appendiculata]